MATNILTKINGFLDGLKTYGILKDSKVYLTFDTIIECKYSRSLEITDYPFETRGGLTRITEYGYNNPDAISMVGIKSYDSIVGGKLAEVFDIKNEIDLIKQKLDYLTSGIFKLQIKTRNGLREYFTLQKYELPENLENFNTLEVSMTFKQVLDNNDKDKNLRDVDDQDTKNGGNLSAKIITSLV